MKGDFGGRPMGSEGSAAGGGYSDLSEWPRSADDDGVHAEETAGHRNRTAPTGGAESPRLCSG